MSQDRQIAHMKGGAIYGDHQRTPTRMIWYSNASAQSLDDWDKESDGGIGV